MDGSNESAMRGGADDTATVLIAVSGPNVRTVTLRMLPPLEIRGAAIVRSLRLKSRLG